MNYSDATKRRFKQLVHNEVMYIDKKMSSIKYADAFFNTQEIASIDEQEVIIDKNIVDKESSDGVNTDLRLKLIINTTNIMDSHEDVHIKGIWDNSLKSNPNILLAQEHKTKEFHKIIASGKDLKAFTRDFTFKDFGYSKDVPTEALVFDAVIKDSRNGYMYDQYKQDYVTNHSVGMRYVKLHLAVNDKEFKDKKETFDKYIDNILNKDEVVKNGLFWAVTEAKVIEGSAVPIGSNYVTPVYNEEKNIPSNEIPEKALSKQKEVREIFCWLNKLN